MKRCSGYREAKYATISATLHGTRCDIFMARMEQQRPPSEHFRRHTWDPVQLAPIQGVENPSRKSDGVAELACATSESHEAPGPLILYGNLLLTPRRPGTPADILPSSP